MERDMRGNISKKTLLGGYEATMENDEGIVIRGEEKDKGKGW